jgi:epoxyqueuosine reductase QueG
MNKDIISETQAAEFITREIKEFARTSPENRLPYDKNYVNFDEPLVRFANGEDTLFSDYKAIIAPTHITPREALAKTYNKKPEELPGRLSVISWILPINEETRKSNRAETKIPTRVWAHTRWYGEFFNEALRRRMVEVLTGMGYLATAPALQPFWSRFEDKQTGQYSNWSERHIAFAAGHGTFSLSDGFISERGIAHRCGSVVTDMALPASERKAANPYANCLFYANGSCKACIARCPAGAITEKGHDKIRCASYQRGDIGYLLKDYAVGVQGCGLCQTNVPCEDKNPVG